MSQPRKPEEDSSKFKAWPLLIVLSSMLLLYVSSRRTSSSGSNIPIPGVPSHEDRLASFGYPRRKDGFDDWDPETMGDVPPYPEDSKDEKARAKARRNRKPKNKANVRPDVPPEFFHHNDP